MRTLMLALALLALASPATAERNRPEDHRSGHPSTAGSAEARDTTWDSWWSTSGELDHPSSFGYTAEAWADWVITAVQGWDVTGADCFLDGFAFPCAGNQTRWALWIQELEFTLPDSPESAEYSGWFFPGEPYWDADPPYPYVYVELPEDLHVWGWSWIVFGYENPGRAGYSAFSGRPTWSWWDGQWWNDADYGLAADLQVMGWFVITATAESSWGAIKSLY